MKTTVTKVVVRWVPGCRYFLLGDPRGDIDIQEITPAWGPFRFLALRRPFRFLSCRFVLSKFLNLDKERPQLYRMTIEHLGDA